MTVRTWRQGNSLMASADAPLDAEALALASAQAHKRWPWIPDVPGILLAGAEHWEEAHDLARERPDLAGDLRQVEGVSGGWAISWVDPDAIAAEEDRSGTGSPG